MKGMNKFDKAPNKGDFKQSSGPTSFYEYSKEDRERLEASTRAKHGEGLNEEEQRFIILKNEAIMGEREDDVPRYGH